MYKFKLTTLAITLIFAISLYGKGSAEKTQTNFKNGIGEIDLLQVDSKKYSAIKFTFEVWTEGEFDQDKYAEIAKQFLNIVRICQQEEQGSDSYRPIADALGTPFKDISGEIFDKEGIHGNLNIKVEDEYIFFEAVLFHDEAYDEDAWQNIMSFVINFVSDEEWIQRLSPIFTNVINVADDLGIHGSLDIGLETR